jgi:hypothetical protein
MVKEAAARHPLRSISRIAPSIAIAVLVLAGVAWAVMLGVRYADDLRGVQRDATDLPDYVVLYSAGSMLLDGRGADLYDLAAIGAAESEASGTPVGGEDVLPYFNPPFVAAFFAPLTLLPLSAFALVLGLLNLSLLFTAGRWLLRQLPEMPGQQRWLLWLAAATGFSVVGVLWHQQFSALILVSWLGFVSFQVRGKEGLSGACLALALVKPQFVLLPLAFLIFHRRWKTLGAFSAIAAALVVVSVAVSGPAVLVDYPRYLLDSTQWTENGIFGDNMLGWQGLLVDLTGENPPARALFLALSLPTVALAAWTWRGSWQEQMQRLPLVMGVALIATLLITPHLYIHDMLLGSLAISFAAVDSIRRTGSPGPWVAVVVTFWVAQLPRSFFFDTSLPILATFSACLFLALVWNLRRDDASAEAGIAVRAAA